MLVLFVPMKIKQGYRDQFLKSMVDDDALGAVRDEPGCLRFDVIQDPEDSHQIFLYEVYRDQAAFEAHTKAPHYLRWSALVKDWRLPGDFPTVRGTNIFPPDDAWEAQKPPAGQ